MRVVGDGASKMADACVRNGAVTYCNVVLFRCLKLAESAPLSQYADKGGMVFPKVRAYIYLAFVI